MTDRIGRAIVLLILALGIGACDGGRTTTPLAPAPPPPPSPPPPPPPPAAFSVVDVTVSGVVFEVTATGRVPIEGVNVANGEGSFAVTDAKGSFSFSPVWVCPCAAQPWVPPGTTFLWIWKAGYDDPPGQPVSVFGAVVGANARDVTINGDTTVEIQLVRR